MNKHLLGTDKLLQRWGRWGQGPNLGLPTMSPMFGERCLKSPIWGADAPNPEIELVSRAINKLKPEDRQFIQRKYMLEWKVREFLAAYHWCAPGKYYRQLERLVRTVHNLIH
jgi:hypothetical protein